MNVSCQCPRMNVTVGWENKSRTSYDTYTCYHGQCYPYHSGTMNKTQCADTCTPPPTPAPTPPPAHAKYYCHHGECRESPWGSQSYDNCSQSCSGGGGGGGGQGKSMGSWFSHPMNGQCNGTHSVGDGSGCAWRSKVVHNAINATCLYNRFDSTVEAYNGSYCFKGCPQPSNATSICYRECYTKVYTDMTEAEAIVPWTAAFASQDESKGGCPTVKIPELTMTAEELNPVYLPEA